MSRREPAWGRTWLFFALTFGWSWLLWILAALTARVGAESFVRPLHYLGGVGPAVTAVVLTHLTRDRRGQHSYWRRVIDFRRISVVWYGVIFLTVPVLAALGALLDVLLGGRGAELGAAARLTSRPIEILPFIAFTLLFGPLPEELGWRGYALDGLQARSNALVSSLVVGVVWTLWHLPLFLIPGTYQNALGVGTFPFWPFMMAPTFQSILMTWIYNNTERSTLSAVLFHQMINATGQLFELTKRAELLQNLLWIAAAGAVTAVWGAKTMTRKAWIADGGRA